MPGEINVNPEETERLLRQAAGKSPQELREAVTSSIVDLTKYVRSADTASRETLDALATEVRERMAVVSVAADEAKRMALPPGQDAEAIRHYRMGDVSKRSVVDLSDTRGARLSERTPFVGVGGQHAPVRLWGGPEVEGERPKLSRERGWRPGLLDDPEPKSANQRLAQELADEIAMCRMLGHSAERSIRELRRVLVRMGLRMFEDNATEGAEWIPDVPGFTLIQYMAMARPELALFRTVPMLRNTMLNPFMTSGLQPFLGGTQAAGETDPGLLRASQVATANITYSLQSFLVRTIAAMDAEEDAIIAFRPTIMRAVAQALQDGMGDALINGDTGTHQDTGLGGWTAGDRWNSAAVGGSDDHRRAHIGLRARAGNDSTEVDLSSASSLAVGAMQLQGQLTKGYSVSDLALIVGLEAYIYHLLDDTNLLTVEKVGLDRATIRTGQVGNIGAIPVVLSQWVSGELNASGRYDDSTKTKTAIILADTSRVVRPVKGGERTSVVAEPQRDVVHMVGKARAGLAYECGDNEKPIAVGYNISNDGT